VNRPVEALQDLQKAIELNENRAVYRSKLLLDSDLAARSASLARIYSDLGFEQLALVEGSDLAARSASLARIYSDLGFEQLALVEGWKSVNTDPGNYSAHRFLADSYSALPRHQIARVSELLQSQLLQPINITPVQPQLAESNLLILEGSGPSAPSFNEFNPLFIRNRLALQANGVVGGNDTLGNDLVFSGLYDKVSFSMGQFHYETDGFRENNDQDHDIYNIFAQASLSPKTSIQAEYRSVDTEKGDIYLLFHPDNFLSEVRKKEDTELIRFGLHHSIGPKSDLIASYSYLKADSDNDWYPESIPGYMTTTDEDGFFAEAQHLFRSEILDVISGIGCFKSDRKDVDSYPPWFGVPTMTSKSDVTHINLYVYTLINYPKNVTWSLGGSVDSFDGGYYDLDENQFNPKFGLTWNPFPDTTIRAAAFRTFKRSLLSNQTLEPTQVAGFNQFYDDGNAADASRYGIGIDQKLSTKLYVGAECSKRDLEETAMVPPTFTIQEFDIDEYLYRVYVYWTPHPWLSIGPEYQFERFERPIEFTGLEAITDLDTHRFSFGINFAHPCGFTARLKPTYVDQDGKFLVPPFIGVEPGDDQFWVVDASIGYRLPKRRGLITVEAKNLFDEDFRFQDTDTSNPEIYPECVILTKFTLAF